MSRIKTLLTFAILIFLVSCNKKLEYQRYTTFLENNSFRKTDSILIKKTYGGIGDVSFFDNNLIFTSIHSPGIYQVDLQTHSIDTIGELGKGPNEYIIPMFIACNRKSGFLYASLGRSFEILRIHLPNQEPELSKRHPVPPHVGAKYIQLDEDYIFHKNMTRKPFLNRYSINKEKNLYMPNSLKDGITPNLYWTQLTLDTVKNRIYTSNYYSYKINIMDYNLNLIKSWDFTDLKEIYPISKNIKNKIDNQKLKYDAIEHFSAIVKLFSMYNNNRYYLISAIKSKGFITDRLNQYNIYHIVDENGNIINKIKDDNRLLLGVNKNKFYILNYKKSKNEENYYIEVISYEL